MLHVYLKRFPPKNIPSLSKHLGELPETATIHPYVPRDHRKPDNGGRRSNYNSQCHQGDVLPLGLPANK